METALAAADLVGQETLEIMQGAPRYNAWQYARIARYLGRRVCEVGCGIGNMSALILGDPRELVVLADVDPYYLGVVKQRFGARGDVAVELLRLPDQSAVNRFRRYRLDTVVALNVLEHIEDDVGAIRTLAHMLQPGGRVIVLVPALEALYGSLDKGLGHYRRYTRESVSAVLRGAGFRVERSFYFNLLGVLGWYLNARVVRARRIPVRQLRWFDRLVPVLRWEDALPLPVGQSVIAVGALP